MVVTILDDIHWDIFSFVLINVWLSNLHNYEFIIIVHAILCLNKREIQKKNYIKRAKYHNWLFLFGHFRPQLFLNIKWIDQTPWKKENKEKKKKKKKTKQRKRKEKKRQNKRRMRKKKKKEKKKRKVFICAPTFEKVNLV